MITIKFRSAKDGWRWRARAANGRIIAESGEAYEEKRGAEHGVSVLLDSIRAGNFQLDTEDEEDT